MTEKRRIYEGPAVTLADLIASNRLLWCYCLRCSHEVEIDPRSLRLDPRISIPNLKRRLVCGSCGSREIDARPQLHQLTLAEIRAARR